MVSYFHHSRPFAALVLLGSIAIVGCTPRQDCIKAADGFVVPDSLMGKIDSDPLPRCVTNYNVPKVINADTDDVAKTHDTPPQTQIVDEISNADTVRADAVGDGRIRESGANNPVQRDPGTSSSTSTVDQETVSSIENGGATTASAITDGQGTLISKRDGRFTIDFEGTDD